MRVDRYADADRDSWDDFVRASRTGTFLHERNYLEYHADRFVDHSLVVRDDDQIIALLPANRDGDVVRSHGGLTYGGLLTGTDATASRTVTVLDEIVAALRTEGVRHLVYKAVPRIYHRLPSDEDAYALFRLGARVARRDVLSVIEYTRRGPVQERRARALRKAARAGLTVRDTDDFAAFWPLLAANLGERFGVRPVHSVEEIRLLAARFPDAIRLSGAFLGDRMLAGAVVYVSRDVCHVQYNAASEEGKRLGALDLTLAALVEQYADRARFFDFGISTEDGGRVLNEGLVAYKEGFGARTVIHDTYELDLDRLEAM